MLRIDVVTIFPGLFEPFLRESIVGIAISGVGRPWIMRCVAVTLTL